MDTVRYSVNGNNGQVTLMQFGGNGQSDMELQYMVHLTHLFPWNGGGDTKRL